MAGVLVRFECGKEDRMSSDVGPFDYVQQTYSELRAGPDGETLLAWHCEDGDWQTPNGEHWSDFVIFAESVPA